MTPDAPSTNGRDARGRFAPGNAGGPGNPFARSSARFRARLHDEVSEADFTAVIRSLVAQAVEGDVRAIAELLNRLIGRPTDADVVERLEALEAALGDASERGHQ